MLRAAPARGALLLAAVLLAGCAPATVVQTNHASDYVARPGRIYVATGAGMGWGSEFSQAFQQKFREIVGACGNTAGFVELSGLELTSARRSSAPPISAPIRC